MSLELLIFEIDDGMYAVPTSKVREVLRAAALIPLPEYPQWVSGGLDLRGELVPVADGRLVLSRERKPMEPADHLIVVENDSGSIALHVDRATTLATAEDESGDSRDRPGKFITRVVHSDHGPTLVMDVDRLIQACDRDAVSLWDPGGPQ